MKWWFEVCFSCCYRRAAFDPKEQRIDFFRSPPPPPTLILPSSMDLVATFQIPVPWRWSQIFQLVDLSPTCPRWCQTLGFCPALCPMAWEWGVRTIKSRERSLAVEPGVSTMPDVPLSSCWEGASLWEYGIFSQIFDFQPKLALLKASWEEFLAGNFVPERAVGVSGLQVSVGSN